MPKSEIKSLKKLSATALIENSLWNKPRENEKTAQLKLNDLEIYVPEVYNTSFSKLYPPLRGLVNSDRISMEIALKIQKKLLNTQDDCVKEILEENIVRIAHAVMTDLITLDQLNSMPTALHLRELFSSRNGWNALIEGIITAEGAAVLPSADQLEYLLLPQGQRALEKGFITPEQAANIKASYLKALFSDRVKCTNEGKKSSPLEKNLITIEELAIIPTEHHLSCLLAYDCGVLKTIKEGYCTLKEIVAMSEPFISCFFTAQNAADDSLYGYKALKEGLITIAQAEKIGTKNGKSRLEYLSRLLELGGLQALRAGRLTSEQVISMGSMEEHKSYMEALESSINNFALTPHSSQEETYDTAASSNSSPQLSSRR